MNALPPAWHVECDMTKILQFVRSSTSFDPETLVILGAAYDRASSIVAQSVEAGILYQLMAGRIIGAATKGERDPERLLRIALRGIPLPSEVASVGDLFHSGSDLPSGTKQPDAV
jgi:hypothetical protein